MVTYQDYVCPFCYVAEAPLARLRTEGFTLDRRPFELRPAPAPLVDVRSPALRDAWVRAVLPLAEQYDIEVREPARSVRTRKAHEAAAYARSQGRLEEMHMAIFRAHFVEGRDIGRIDVLAAIGGEVGLDDGELKFMLSADRWMEQVVTDERAAAAIGITAVPAFVRQSTTGVQALFGVRDHDTLRRWVQGDTTERSE